MAKARVPDPLKRRHLIEKDLGEAQSLAIAETYLAEGRTTEAIAFLRKAGADDRLAQLEDEAVESGDAFLLKQVADARDRDPGAERWLALAEAAEAAGKQRYVQMARRHARSSE